MHSHLAPEPPEGFTVNEPKPGVFVAVCEKCGNVAGVKHTRTEIELASLSHVCPDPC